DKGGRGDPGRDHNGRGFCTWLAGGGARGGTAYGATDELGNRAVDNRVHVHDLHATVLALLGFDHTKLTYRYNGRDFRLTDNYGNVVKGVVAESGARAATTAAEAAPTQFGDESLGFVQVGAASAAGFPPIGRRGGPMNRCLLTAILGLATAA